jgi:hypothetical protein
MDIGAFAGSDKSFEKAKNFAISENLVRMTKVLDKPALSSNDFLKNADCHSAAQ